MRIDETYLKGFIVEEQFYKGIEFINVNRMWRYWGQVLYVTKIQKIGNVSTQFARIR